MPEISVVIATYNGEKYIEAQLQSVLDQTLQPDEVIIFDDHSWDNTSDIVENFIKNNHLNWALSINGTNLGFIKNFFQAIRMASGKYIFLCDQDDVWHNDKIEKMMHLFYAHHEIRAINTGFCTIDQNGFPLVYTGEGISNELLNGRVKQKTLKKVDVAHIIRKNISPGCTIAFDQKCRSVFLDNASQRWPHDWELNMFAAMMNGLYFYGDKLIDYRIHEDNVIGLKRKVLCMTSEKGDIRLELARNEYERVSLYINKSCISLMNGRIKKQLEKYYRFTHERYKTLQKKSIYGWIRSFIHMTLYFQAVGLKGMIGDGVYIIKRMERC